MKKSRPYADGNMQEITTGLRNRVVSVLEQDIVKMIVDKSVSGVTYVCKAETGTATSESKWQICRITASGSIETIEWADGNGYFDNVADDRLALTYK